MRALALLLVLANALFFVWTQGWLDGVAGVRAHGDREPERLARQVRPEAIRVVRAPVAASAPPDAVTAALPAAAASDAAPGTFDAPAAGMPAGSASGSPVVAAGGSPAAVRSGLPPAATSGSAVAAGSGSSVAAMGGSSVAATSAAATGPASGPSAPTARPAPALGAAPTAAAAVVVTSTEPALATACLQAGPFTDAEFEAARTALSAAQPALRVADVALPRAGGWMVYMGRYADRDAQLRKEDELRRIAIVFEEVGAPPGLGPGLALGRYANRAAAEAALAQFARRGIRTARVVEAEPPAAAHLLRLDRLDAASRAGVAALRLPALGRGFSACPAVR